MINQNPEQIACVSIDPKFDVDTNRVNQFKLSALTQFIDDFSVLKDRLVTEKIDHYKNLLSRWLPYSEKLSLYNKTETPHFNFFNIIKIANLRLMEDEVHTPFLGNLLNVRGTHHQGSLFYERFLEVCIPENTLRYKFIPEEYSRLFIEEEISTYNGRMDILISYHGFDKSFAICIENKINAPDQCRQLERYHEILQAEYKNYIIFYLTPGGKRPSSISISSDNLNKLISLDQLRIISYKHHITNVIRSALASIKSDKLSGSLKQYLEII